VKVDGVGLYIVLLCLTVVAGPRHTTAPPRRLVETFKHQHTVPVCQAVELLSLQYAMQTCGFAVGRPQSCGLEDVEVLQERVYQRRVRA